MKQATDIAPSDQMNQAPNQNNKFRTAYTKQHYPLLSAHETSDPRSSETQEDESATEEKGSNREDDTGKPSPLP
jgi:hypothetical protein